MRLEIHHSLTYAFSKAVFLEPHIIRMTPLCNATQELLAHSLEVQPEPVGTNKSIDLGGTTTVTAWFEGLHSELRVSSTSTVEACRENPFDFYVVEDSTLKLPAKYSGALQNSLRPFLISDGASPSVAEFGERIAGETNRQTLPFLSALTQAIHGSFEQFVRWEGDPWPAEKTLAEQRGACRDLTVLFMEVCRSQGLASRYVSGYHVTPDNDDNHLHAWAQVYLPGGGWRGFDPTTGLAVAAHHVGVAYAPTSELAAPLSGAFRGTNAESTMSYEITAKILS